jgi:hypothetical protein
MNMSNPNQPPSFNLGIDERPIDERTLTEGLTGPGLAKAIRLARRANALRDHITWYGTHLGIGEKSGGLAVQQAELSALLGIPMPGAGEALDEVPDRPVKAARKAARGLRQTEQELVSLHGGELPRVVPKEDETPGERPPWMKVQGVAEPDSEHVQAGKAFWEEVERREALRATGRGRPVEPPQAMGTIVVADRFGGERGAVPIHPPGPEPPPPARNSP